MLNDRDYMRRRRREDSDPETGGMRSLFILIVANVLAFILFRTPDFRLVPQIFQSGDYWTIVTALFMHDSLWHLFFNMFSLYIFGQMVAPVLGTKRFLALYFAHSLKPFCENPKRRSSFLLLLFYLINHLHSFAYNGHEKGRREHGVLSYRRTVYHTGAADDKDA